MVGTVAYMPPEQALGRTPDAAQRPLLARRDALRDGHRPAAVPRRRRGRDHLAAHQHAAGRAVLAQPARCRAALEALDPAAAREGARASARRRGEPRAAPRRALADRVGVRAGDAEPRRRAGEPARPPRRAASSSGASARSSELRARARGRARRPRPARDAGRRAGHRQDAHGAGARHLRAPARRPGAVGPLPTRARARRPTGRGSRSSAPTCTTATPKELQVRDGRGRRRHRAGRLRGARACCRTCPRRRALEPEQARFRLFDSITTFLQERVAARSRWCSSSTTCTGPTSRRCCCSQFLARELSGARLLVVGTYRDVELSREHPLSQTLAELTRESLARPRPPARPHAARRRRASSR